MGRDIERDKWMGWLAIEEKASNIQISLRSVSFLIFFFFLSTESKCA